MNLQIKMILFDFDGTLADTGMGIMNGARYALNKYDIEPSEELLRSFIGPPLYRQFMKVLGADEEEGQKAVAYYREYYTDIGLYESCLYEGVEEMLKTLKRAGYLLAVASSKPEKFVKTLTDRFGISQYFDYIGGSLMDGRRTQKSEVIEYVLQMCGVSDYHTVCMVGDRCYDITGAKELGIHSMGVLFGYGTREEMEEAGAEMIAETPEEITQLLV